MSKSGSKCKGSNETTVEKNSLFSKTGGNGVAVADPYIPIPDLIIRVTLRGETEIDPEGGAVWEQDPIADIDMKDAISFYFGSRLVHDMQRSIHDDQLYDVGIHGGEKIGLLGTGRIRKSFRAIGNGGHHRIVQADTGIKIEQRKFRLRKTGLKVPIAVRRSDLAQEVAVVIRGKEPLDIDHSAIPTGFITVD
jgi:hypothetical protein